MPTANPDLYIREITEEEKKTIENDFSYHPPGDKQSNRYMEIRYLFRYLALDIFRMCPPSRELSLAKTKLEEAMFWANAAIARNETPGVEENHE